MSTRVHPELRQEVAEFGGNDIDVCMNCGNCTAICPLSQDSTGFPRKIIRYLQLGLKDRLLHSPEPWMCYYCGDCSETCPREANPGETMMAARRYLTAQYDWTGLSRRLYTSRAWEVGMLLGVALFVVALFYFFHGPMVTTRVELNTFAPVAWVELGDWFVAAILSGFLLSNALRMFRMVMGGADGPKVPFRIYVQELRTLALHAATQIRWRECEKPGRWVKHLFLVSGYVTMFLLVVVFLRWLQTDQIPPIYYPTRLLGYYATLVLLYFTAEAMVSRVRKQEEIHKHTHLTDWMFLVLLFLTAFTGILGHIFHLAGMPLPCYYTYVIHLAVAVAMLIVEVPFGKWAHLAYRPLVVYLMRVRERARELPVVEVVAATGS